MIDAADTQDMPGPDGAALLDEVHSVLKKYVAFGNDHQAVTVALWIAATHALPAWNHATRLVIDSPLRRCGKSRLLDIAALLSHAPLMVADVSPAAIYRTIGKGDDATTPTIFYDEADAAFGTIGGSLGARFP